MENFNFIVFVGVKQGENEKAKADGIKFDTKNKKWYMEFNFSHFMNNSKFHTHGFKPYAIQIFGQFDKDFIKDKHTTIYNLLMERLENKIA